MAERFYDENGELHRDDGPAVINDNGSQAWYKHGKLHRIGGPATIHANGDEGWFVDGKLHRLDGPASDWITRKLWFVNGEHIYCNSQAEFEQLMRLKAFW